MTMWQELRKNYTNYTLEDVGKMVNRTRQAMSRYELGQVRMPYDIQIVYFGFRNNEYDKQLIECLKEMVVR